MAAPQSMAQPQHPLVATVASYHAATSYQDSAKLLQTLIKAGHLKYTDMRDSPEHFFAAHRLLATQVLLLLPLLLVVQISL